MVHMKGSDLYELPNIWADRISRRRNVAHAAHRQDEQHSAGSYLIERRQKRKYGNPKFAYCSRDEICMFLAIAKLLKTLVGQGRNRTADAGLFRAAYRFA